MYLMIYLMEINIKYVLKKSLNIVTLTFTQILTLCVSIR